MNAQPTEDEIRTAYWKGDTDCRTGAAFYCADPRLAIFYTEGWEFAEDMIRPVITLAALERFTLEREATASHA